MRKTHNFKARKGFSLVELVVVIIIIAVLAVAIFAGGSAVIKKSQVSRTVSDLHNFSVATEGFMNEHPEVLNTAALADIKTLGTDLVKAYNDNLPADYQLEPAAATTNITINTIATDAEGNTAFAYQSKKTDAWGNHYFVVFDFAERHGTQNSDFYITVISAGPNAKTDIAGTIDDDDIFLLVQDTNGDVSAATFNCAADKLLYTSAITGVNEWTTVQATKMVSETGHEVSTYNYKPSAGTFTADTAKACPVNF